VNLTSFSFLRSSASMRWCRRRDPSSSKRFASSWRRAYVHVQYSPCQGFGSLQKIDPATIPVPPRGRNGIGPLPKDST
jgi:hypothetical protein